MRWLIPVIATALALGAALACSSETIVLATVPEEDDAGAMTPSTFKRCFGNDECDSGQYCQIDRADETPPTGHCAHRPFQCTDVRFNPVCAIGTGISYYNDCYRKAAGESFAVSGDCDEHAKQCDLVKGTSCPLGTVCALLGTIGEPGKPRCGLTAGTCWGQMRCPSPDDDGHGPRWDDCSTRPGALRCVDTCTAIQTGQPFTYAKPTPTCQ